MSLRSPPGAGAGQAGVFSTINLTGGQIQFPAVQNPSANPNTLDDYEEGLWTPVLTFGTPGDLVVAYSVQQGCYTRVGDTVTLSFNIRTSTFTFTTGTGLVIITGIPYNSANVTDQEFFGSLAWAGITKATYTQVASRIVANSPHVRMLASGSTVATSPISATDTPTGGTVELRGTISYKAV